jgi:murein L,D-transpeptidase YafK
MVKRFIKTALLVILALSIKAQGTFKTSQLKYERVRKAYNTKWADLKKELVAGGFDANAYEIYLRVFKHEKEVQVWMRNLPTGQAGKGDAKFKLFKTYAICSSSGELGPKRVQGDGQVPEGFYYIESFNPVSSYHLSMKVGYPNKSDAKKATGSPGGDIMIHGNCVTIGCIPIENDPIEELYVLCVEAKDRKQSLRVDMFPCKFTAANVTMLNKDFSKELNGFWGTLKAGYDFFETNFTIPKFTVDAKGDYFIVK